MAGSAKHTMVLLDRDGTLIREMDGKRLPCSIAPAHQIAGIEPYP